MSPPEGLVTEVCHEGVYDVNEYIPALNPVEFQLSPDSIIKRCLSENLDLCFAQSLLHTVKAKFRDCYPHTRRQYRPQRTGGFFSSVESSSGGFSSSVRGLQDGVNRNKRVVFLVSDNSTRQSCPNVKTNDDCP